MSEYKGHPFYLEEIVPVQTVESEESLKADAAKMQRMIDEKTAKALGVDVADVVALRLWRSK